MKHRRAIVCTICAFNLPANTASVNKAGCARRTQLAPVRQPDGQALSGDKSLQVAGDNGFDIDAREEWRDICHFG